MNIKRHSTLNFNQINYNKPFSPEGTNRVRRYFIDDTVPLSKLSCTRRKKDPSQQNRGIQIQRNNRLLLNRITEIMGKPRRQFQTQIKKKQKKSLNAGYQRQISQKIQIENAKILQRIMKTKSQYDYGKRTDRIQKTIKRIKVRRIPNMNRIQTNPEMDQRILKLQKTLKLNNTIIHVKIFLTTRSLLIEGKTQSGVIKIIQIPRQQAIEFVETECDSKLENIFGLLSYSNATLFLKGQTTTQQIPQKPKDTRKYYTQEQDYNGIQQHHVQHSSQLPSLHTNQQFHQISNMRMST